MLGLNLEYFRNLYLEEQFYIQLVTRNTRKMVADIHLIMFDPC